MKTTATIDQLHQALQLTTAEFNGNIRFKDIKQISSKRVQFTLTVNDSRAPGGRISHSGRRVKAACWHVHGKFFDHLWTINPEAVIDAGTLRMHGPRDNWQDRNIGSMFSPMMYSEACDC